MACALNALPDLRHFDADSWKLDRLGGSSSLERGNVVVVFVAGGTGTVMGELAGRDPTVCRVGGDDAGQRLADVGCGNDVGRAGRDLSRPAQPLVGIGERPVAGPSTGGTCSMFDRAWRSR